MNIEEINKIVNDYLNAKLNNEKNKFKLELAKIIKDYFDNITSLHAKYSLKVSDLDYKHIYSQCDLLLCSNLDVINNHIHEINKEGIKMRGFFFESKFIYFADIVNFSEENFINEIKTDVIRDLKNKIEYQRQQMRFHMNKFKELKYNLAKWINIDEKIKV